jgi:hypothetical protein
VAVEGSRLQTKISIIVPVWGASYVKRFAQLALPSWLAGGNVPALAAAAEVEIVVMTNAEALPSFDLEPGFASLKRMASVRFVAIDDLIARKMYGVTLTLAFMRGIASAGAEMVNRHFVFLNGDFILADGSLRSLLARIQAGDRCILAPSFRANAEDVEPILEERVDAASGVLTIPPREMVALALKHLHPTTVAKTVNQALFRSMHPNQLYWRIDENTMLGRFYLIFMLCIRPERVVTTINSFCDYGFVPELCPASAISVLQDSDDFFMLETQHRHQESEHIRPGAMTTGYLASRLSEWTTREHRIAASHDLIFHSSNLPGDMAARRAEAARYVEEISRQLGEPKDHAVHPYWGRAIRAWRIFIQGGGRSPDVPELGASAGGLALPAQTGPDVGIWHPDWPDYRLIRRSVSDILAAHGGRILAIGDADLLDIHVPQKDARITRRPRWALPGLSGEDNGAAYDCAILVTILRDVQVTELRGIERVFGLVKPGGEIALVIDNIGPDGVPGDLTESLAPSLLNVMDASIGHVSMTASGGVMKERIRIRLSRLSIAPLLWVWKSISLLNNVFARLQGTRPDIPYGTSLVLRVIKSAPGQCSVK